MENADLVEVAKHPGCCYDPSLRKCADSEDLLSRDAEYDAMVGW